MRSAFIRVGRGGGFHNITGDWSRYSIDHLPNWGRKKPTNKNDDQPLKTRQLLVHHGEGPKYSFSPMGFIKLSLCTKQEYLKHINIIL